MRPPPGLRVWLAAIACCLCACASGPTSTWTAEASPVEPAGWIGFGLVVEDGAPPGEGACQYHHWDAGGNWTVPSEAIWRLEQPLLRAQVARAEPGIDELGFPALSVTLAPADVAAFRALSARAIGRRLAVLVDGQVVTAPVVAGPIPGPFQISGRFSEDDVRLLIRRLEPSGAG